MATDTNKTQDDSNNGFGLPRTEFSPLDPSDNNQWRRMTIIIAGIVLVIGAGVIFWLFQRSSSKSKNNFMNSTLENHQLDVDEEEDENNSRQSNKTRDAIKGNTVGSKKNEDFTSDADNSDLEGFDKIPSSFNAKTEQKSVSFIEQLREENKIPNNIHQHSTEEASIVNITSPNGTYYVVISSYVDMDLAMDYAKKLVQKGISVKLLTPKKGKYFVRLSIANDKSLEKATKKAQELKEKYGENVWVMKY